MPARRPKAAGDTGRCEDMWVLLMKRARLDIDGFLLEAAMLLEVVVLRLRPGLKTTPAITIAAVQLVVSVARKGPKWRACLATVGSEGNAARGTPPFPHLGTEAARNSVETVICIASDKAGQTLSCLKALYRI